jgi:protein TonB
MFDDTLNPSWNERSRRGMTTLTSFGLQALAVGVLLIVPLLRPTGLPMFRALSTPVSLGQPLGEAPVTRAHAGGNTVVRSSAADTAITIPREIPRRIAEGGDDGPPQIGVSGPYVPGVTGLGSRDGLTNTFGPGTQPIMPVAPRPVVAPLRISHMSEGNLIRKVLPQYPPLARSARIQGSVVLQAVISKEGVIENLRVVTGHPMLVPPAIDAVRQWRYRPYILNNEPVEVETQITVNFGLGGN